MSFTYDMFLVEATKNRDRLRLLIGDTSSANYKFEDAELDDLITQHTNLNLCAYYAYLAMIADKAYLCMRFNMSRHEIDERQIPLNMLEVAKRFKANADAERFTIGVVAWEDEAKSIADGDIKPTAVGFISNTSPTAEWDDD